jgi:hypothetical protein
MTIRIDARIKAADPEKHLPEGVEVLFVFSTNVTTVEGMTWEQAESLHDKLSNLIFEHKHNSTGVEADFADGRHPRKGVNR